MTQEKFYKNDIVVYKGTAHNFIVDYPGFVLDITTIEDEQFAEVNFHTNSSKFEIVQKTVKLNNLNKIRKISLKLRRYFPMFGVLIESNEKSEIFLERKYLFFDKDSKIDMANYNLVTLDLKNGPPSFEWLEYVQIMESFNYLFQPYYNNHFNNS